jgi:hypothetical protein
LWLRLCWGLRWLWLLPCGLSFLFYALNIPFYDPAIVTAPFYLSEVYAFFLSQLTGQGRGF